jgi:hypothetical protein
MSYFNLNYVASYPLVTTVGVIRSSILHQVHPYDFKITIAIAGTLLFVDSSTVAGI